MATKSQFQSTAVNILPLAGISDWKELYFIESADDLHETYSRLMDVIDSCYVPIPLTFESMCEVLSTMFDFVRTHAISMLEQDVAIWCDVDDPYRTSVEVHHMGRSKKMDRSSFVIAFELILASLYDIMMSAHFSEVNNHDAAFAEFCSCMYSCYSGSNSSSTKT
jgi:hypothetical protein